MSLEPWLVIKSDCLCLSTPRVPALRLSSLYDLCNCGKRLYVIFINSLLESKLMSFSSQLQIGVTHLRTNTTTNLLKPPCERTSTPCSRHHGGPPFSPSSQQPSQANISTATPTTATLESKEKEQELLDLAGFEQLSRAKPETSVDEAHRGIWCLSTHPLRWVSQIRV